MSDNTKKRSRRASPVQQMDATDLRILRVLQKDCSQTVSDVAKSVGLSTTPCWRRIQKLEESGIVQRRVALVDRTLVDMTVTVFVGITTNQHSQEWFDKFHATIRDFPEVVDFYRMSGSVDYLLRVIVPSIGAYDEFYKRLISRIEISDVTSNIALEEIKTTTELPLDYLEDK